MCYSGIRSYLYVCLSRHHLSSIKSVWPSMLFRDGKLSICLFQQIAICPPSSCPPLPKLQALCKQGPYLFSLRDWHTVGAQERFVEWMSEWLHDAPLEKSVDLWAFLWTSLSCSSSTWLPKKPEAWSCSRNSGFRSAVSFAWNSPSHSTAGPCSSFRSPLCSEARLISLFPFCPRLVPLAVLPTHSPSPSFLVPVP